jgi:hypothetical protein
MRTTLDIADDILFAAKEVARREKRSLGAVISDLARSALTAPPTPPAKARTVAGSRLQRFGIQPLPARGGVVSNQLIDRLRDEEGV